MHVAQAAIVDERGLGRTAAQPCARRADAAIAAAKDAGASVGGDRIAGAMAADRSMHGARDVSAPPVGIMSAGSAAGSTVEEARAPALATFEGAFRALAQPKYSPAKRKSMEGVLGEVKMRATRMGANTEIYGSCNYFSGRTGMQLRQEGMRFSNISTGDLAAQVRSTLKASFDEPCYLSGSSLTAEAVTTEALMEILRTCASEAKLTNIAALTAVWQYILELRRSNEGLSVQFTKVCLLARLHGCPSSTGCPIFASHSQRRVVLNDPDHSERDTESALTRRPWRGSLLAVSHPSMSFVRFSVFRTSGPLFYSPSELPVQQNVGEWGRGDNDGGGLRAATRCTPSGGVRAAPGYGRRV